MISRRRRASQFFRRREGPCKRNLSPAGRQKEIGEILPRLLEKTLYRSPKVSAILFTLPVS
jgi:hypothetical protein